MYCNIIVDLLAMPVESLKPAMMLVQVTFALLAMFAMVKRSRWPADQEEAKAGGFVVDYTPTGAPIHRSPGAALFLSFLPNLLALIR